MTGFSPCGVLSCPVQSFSAASLEAPEVLFS